MNVLATRVAARWEQARASLFVVPMLFVLAGVALGAAMLAVDDRLEDAAGLPFVLQPTVDSARAVVTTVAGATMTVAGIAFSIALLVVQLASSQYSPRVTHGLFRDSTNKRIMGVVLGTFTYCLVILQAVRDPIGDGSTEVASLSTSMALVLGVTSLLAIVAFIDHNAHMMDVSEILEGISASTISSVEAAWPPRGARSDGDRASAPAPTPPGPGHRVDAGEDGWIQQIDAAALLELVRAGGTVRLETAAGRYAVRGTPLCTVWPTPLDPEETDRRARAAVQTGDTRTLQQDLAYGVRQLADVGLRALSPGTNDPTTAQDAIFHLVAVLRTMLERRPPGDTTTDDDRTLLVPHAPGDAELLDLAFSEIRRSAGPHPQVSLYLLEALALLRSGLDPTHPALPAIESQARAVVEQSHLVDQTDPDRRLIEDAHRHRFGAVTSAGTEANPVP